MLEALGSILRTEKEGREGGRGVFVVGLSG
jgi:hypothetical protein